MTSSTASGEFDPPAAPRRTAVILGASGATGRRLLPLLLADPVYARVVAVGRRETGVRHPRLIDRVVDFEDLATGMTGLQADDGYCTFGTTLRIAGSEATMTRIDHDYVIEFATACRQAGARRFAYLSAANADARARVFYARLKGRTEDELMRLGFDDLAIYRPGMIVAEREDRRWAESMLFPLLPLIDPLLVGGLAKYRSIPVERLARAIARFGTEQGSGVRTVHWPDMAD